jgi:hypothetical protein
MQVKTVAKKIGDATFELDHLPIKITIKKTEFS